MLSELINTILLNVAVWLWFSAAVFLLWFARAGRRRLVAVLVFLALFWISGTAPFARLVMGPLESKYAPPALASLQKQNVQDVVVLTGGGYVQTGELSAGALPHASSLRFLSGMELCTRLAPDCRIIFSGSAGQSNTDIHAAGTMQALGTVLEPDRTMTAESRSNSTLEHPENVKPLVGTAPFALVTSAYHMPRAMLVFERAGLHAIPYPVDYYTHVDWQWNDLVPSPSGWETLNLALHEYVGILSYSVEP